MGPIDRFFFLPQTPNSAAPASSAEQRARRADARQPGDNVADCFHSCNQTARSRSDYSKAIPEIIPNNAMPPALSTTVVVLYVSYFAKLPRTCFKKNGAIGFELNHLNHNGLEHATRLSGWRPAG